MSLETGDRLGHYIVLGSLGEGGMGEVYLAEDTQLERKIPLKVLPSEMASDPHRLARFERFFTVVHGMVVNTTDE